MSIINKSPLQKEGFVCFAGPFLPHEEAMMPAFVKDAVAANKEVQKQVTANGTYLWQRSKLGR
jgi:hypothetical protein